MWESPTVKLLLHLNASNNSTDNIDMAREHRAEFLIKRNLRDETAEAWLAMAKAQQDAPESTHVESRSGKTT